MSSSDVPALNWELRVESRLVFIVTTPPPIDDFVKVATKSHIYLSLSFNLHLYLLVHLPLHHHLVFLLVHLLFHHHLVILLVQSLL